VRGICCLRPGVPGISERIRVISIVDRFLEHARIWFFEAGGKRDIWLSSADWMPRNFIRRVEVAFPVEDASLKDRIADEVLGTQLLDNVKARFLHADGRYERIQPGSYGTPATAGAQPGEAAGAGPARHLSRGAAAGRRPGDVPGRAAPGAPEAEAPVIKPLVALAALSLTAPWRRVAPGVDTAPAAELGGDAAWAARVVLIDPAKARFLVRYDPSRPTIGEWRRRYPSALVIVTARSTRGTAPTCGRPASWWRTASG